MIKLTPRLESLLKHGARMAGAFEPEILLPFIEEQMTQEENDTALKFLTWVTRNSKKFGHNLPEVFAEFEGKSVKKAEPAEPSFLGCPFCGLMPRVTKHHKEEVWNLVHRCRVFGSMSIDWTTKEQIAQAWNTRV